MTTSSTKLKICSHSNSKQNRWTKYSRKMQQPQLSLTLLALITLQTLFIYHFSLGVETVSIKPADFDRLIMPCYLGGGSTGASSYALSSLSGPPGLSQNPLPQGGSYNNGQLGRSSANGQASSSSGPQTGNGFQPSYYGSDANRPTVSTYQAGRGRDLSSELGQHVPRASSIENFIALVGKIEAANPRLATDTDQLIRTLLGRFRMDNYYYDVRARIPIVSDQDSRNEIIQSIFGGFRYNQAQSQSQSLNSDVFPEHMLDHDEKCSMYFMLSHFIEKSTPSMSPLASIPVTQQSSLPFNQRPPSLQAAGSGYPAVSADQSYSGSGSRYPGPSPSYGSPATNNLNSFGSGLSNNNLETSNKNPFGMNVPQPNPQFNTNYNNLRNNGPYSGTATSNIRYGPPYMDGNARNRDERIAVEYGVVTVANQPNSAIVLNRVLLGILAASEPPQLVRQLGSSLYPTRELANSPRMDEELDPLYAVTLADLWAISAIPKAGKPLDNRNMGDNGRWNDSMCPTSFTLERSNSIKFTTAEMLGGLDGLNLGMLRRSLMRNRRNIKLSEMLKLYYSKDGFRPQYAEFGVCSRATAILNMDDLRRQSEIYSRLYQLNLPISDNEISNSIQRNEYFREFARQVANNYMPAELCQESNLADLYPINEASKCEIGKADVVSIMDTSTEANEGFMNLVIAKLAQRIGLSRQGNTFSILTNQQDTTGYGGSYSFNALVRNSTNIAEIGCSLSHDTTRTYQGGQITDPTRLVEMFERALVNLDTEYLIRQSSSAYPSSTSSLTSSYNRQPSYVSSLFGSTDSYYSLGVSPKNTGGSKVIIWFNYGSPPKQSSLSSGPTNWNQPGFGGDSNSQYRFQEAKKYLKENFRGASILAVSTNRDDVKPFVYDESRDIFTEIPSGTGGNSLSIGHEYSNGMDSSSLAALSGPAEQLVSRLMQRMCDIPALFQYPMCFREASDNVASNGYITPGRKQYWMMTPKTFFSSQNVRMVFKVEGGRLRVCFGRMPRPDESAAKNPQSYEAGSIALSMSSSSGQNNFNTGPISSSSSSSSLYPSTSSSSSNYYTGLEYGLCKDVSPGQVIDFIVSEPCYKKAIADCEPFYFVINEISNPGEQDPNYMCREDACKRFDQVKFTMSHTGVTCSGCSRAKISWILILTSLIFTCRMSGFRLSMSSVFKSTLGMLSLTVTLAILFSESIIQQVHAQNSAPQDFGQGRYGEKRGSLTPSEVLAIILLIMTILAGLALTIALCYYVTKRNSRGMVPVEQEDY